MREGYWKWGTVGKDSAKPGQGLNRTQNKLSWSTTASFQAVRRQYPCHAEQLSSVHSPAPSHLRGMEDQALGASPFPHPAYRFSHTDMFCWVLASLSCLPDTCTDLPPFQVECVPSRFIHWSAYPWYLRMWHLEIGLLQIWLVKMRSHWSRGSPQTSMTSVLITRGSLDTDTTHRE